MTGAELVLLACATVGTLGVLVSWFATTTKDGLFVFYVLLLMVGVAGLVLL